MASLVDWLQPVESIVFKKGSGLLLHTEAPVTMPNILDFPPPPLRGVLDIGVTACAGRHCSCVRLTAAWPP